MAIIEIRNLSAHDLRSLCIRKKWYTRGTCEQYENLFAKLSDQTTGEPLHMTTERIYEIALDIMEHSRMDAEYGVPEVMYELAAACSTFFSEV